jgi:hypothetical protein
MARTCYLHIGTHRTGTTSLQTFLTKNEQSLQLDKIYIPKTGRLSPGTGHHNIAWELNDDPRFSRSLGTLSDLIMELRSIESCSICITSEDFEYLHRRLDSLNRLLSDLSAIGYNVTIIVYLRPQGEYIESLYTELVKHGLCIEFGRFLEQTIRTGQFVLFDIWRFALDYSLLLNPFAEVFGSSHIIVRRYPSRRDANYLINDFLSVISHGISTAGYRYPQYRENPSANFIDVIRCFLLNAADVQSREQSPSRLGNASLPRCSPFVKGRFDPVHLPETVRIYRRFGQSNSRLRRSYGVAVPCITRSELFKDVVAAVGLNADSTNRKKLLRLCSAEDPVQVLSQLERYMKV